jgi:hypothetical protein
MPILQKHDARMAPNIARTTCQQNLHRPFLASVMFVAPNFSFPQKKLTRKRLQRLCVYQTGTAMKN